MPDFAQTMGKPFAFWNSVIHQKTLELLERYDIHPMMVEVTANLSPDGEHYILNITDNFGTSPERLEKLQQLYKDLGIEETKSIITEGHHDLYDILCAAIEKAPKSFTRYQ